MLGGIRTAVAMNRVLMDRGNPALPLSASHRRRHLSLPAVEGRCLHWIVAILLLEGDMCSPEAVTLASRRRRLLLLDPESSVMKMVSTMSPHRMWEWLYGHIVGICRPPPLWRTWARGPIAVVCRPLRMYYVCISSGGVSCSSDLAPMVL